MHGPVRGSVWLLFMPLTVFFAFCCPGLSFSASWGDNSEKVRNYDIHGYFKSFFTVYQNPSISGTNLTYEERMESVVTNTLRLKLFWKPLDSFTVHVAYALSPELNGRNPSSDEHLGDTTGSDSLSYRVYDLRQRLYPRDRSESSDFIIQNNLDRFFATVTTPSMDLLIGRQPIAFGSSRAINPTDVLVPYTFETLDKEERVGVDAFRVKFPIGVMGEFDIGYVFGDEFEFSESAFFMRLKSYLRETDISLIAVGFRNNVLGGIDIAKAVGGASTWFEAAWTFADMLDNYNKKEDYFRLSMGADYNLKDGLYGFIEYHFNGAGTGKPEDYFSNAEGIAFTKGGVYLLGEHYLAPGLSGQLTPLLSCNGQILLNVTDPSAFVAIAGEYNFAQDVFIDLGAFVPLGKQKRQQSPRSEFGLYPTIYYMSIRLYF